MDRPSPNSGPENKREAPRWRLRLRCQFEAEGKVRSGVITDISHGGAFVEAEKCPLAGAEVTLRVSIASRDFELPGRVRHSGWFLQDLYNGHGFGVEFGALNEPSRVLVGKILDRLDTPAPMRTVLEP